VAIINIIRPYCMQTVHGCRLLLHMLYVAWSVCLSVCVLGSPVS